MQVVLHRSWRELEPLANDWNRLLEKSESDTVFLTWEWCNAWWKIYGSGRPIFVLTAWEDQELVGVGPFYQDNVRHWHREFTCLRLLGAGSGDSDYLDCFAIPGREREVMSFFLSFLDSAHDGWDWIDIETAPENSSCIKALGAIANERGWKTWSQRIKCTSITLPKTWDTYLETLRPRVRTKIRSSLRYAEQHLRVDLLRCEQVADTEIWLAELFELHTRRWSTKQRPGVFRGVDKRSFYRALTESALRSGWLAFHRLSWGDRTLALQYGFRYHNRFYVLQEGYDPSFAALRPGLALRATVICEAIEQGLTEYDFLAGSATHKLNLGASEKFSCRVLLARNSLAELISISLPSFSNSVREGAGKLLPEGLRALRHELAASRNGSELIEARKKASSTGSRLLRWSVSRLYSDTAVGPISRRLADRYGRAGSSVGGKNWHPRSVPLCVVFRYHRINDHSDPFFNALPVARFRAQIEYFAENFRFVSLDQIASGDLPCNGRRCSIALTFDDGYRDNYLHAFPILRRFKVPATVFLTTGYIDSGELTWYDQVRLAFKLTTQSTISLKDIGGSTVSLKDESSRLSALRSCLDWLRMTSDPDRVSWLPKLFAELRVPRPLELPGTMLRWDEVRRMSKENITFGAHTVTHPVLGGLKSSQLRDEIAGSKQTIEDKLQSPVRHFAYPFGKHSDFTREAKNVVREVGFKTAVTTISGINGPATDRFELRRMGFDEPDPGLFGLKLDWLRVFANSAG